MLRIVALEHHPRRLSARSPENLSVNVSREAVSGNNPGGEGAGRGAHQYATRTLIPGTVGAVRLSWTSNYELPLAPSCRQYTSFDHIGVKKARVKNVLIVRDDLLRDKRRSQYPRSPPENDAFGMCDENMKKCGTIYVAIAITGAPVV